MNEERLNDLVKMWDKQKPTICTIDEDDIESIKFLLQQNKILQKRIDDTTEFCNYLLNNKEVEIKGERYFKHSCDDIITNAILEKLKGEAE